LADTEMVELTIDELKGLATMATNKKAERVQLSVSNINNRRALFVGFYDIPDKPNEEFLYIPKRGEEADNVLIDIT
jgi:hypothetical protein